MTDFDLSIRGDELFEELGTEEGEIPELFLGDRDEVDSWERYICDIKKATNEIFIDMPGAMDDDIDALEELIVALSIAEKNGVKICIRVSESVSLAKALNKYRIDSLYVTTPITIIDKEKIWFGEPLSSPDFISEGNIIETKYYPCLRFEGKHTARMLKAIFEIPTLKREKSSE